MKHQSSTGLHRPIVSPWQERAHRTDSEKPLSIAAGEILDQVRLALSHDLNAANACVARLTALLGSNAAQQFQLAPAKGGLAPWQKRNVLAYIDSRLDEAVSIRSLADVASLSVSYFCHAFKESFGLAPHAYIIRKRVTRAQELMLMTSEPLSQIALSCGFADQGHLSKVFRREMGQSPNVWRRFHAVERRALSTGSTASEPRRVA